MQQPGHAGRAPGALVGQGGGAPQRRDRPAAAACAMDPDDRGAVRRRGHRGDVRPRAADGPAGHVGGLPRAAAPGGGPGLRGVRVGAGRRVGDADDERLGVHRAVGHPDLGALGRARASPPQPSADGEVVVAVSRCHPHVQPVPAGRRAAVPVPDPSPAGLQRPDRAAGRRVWRLLSRTRMDMPITRPLAGVRVIESSMLGPAELGGLLADLGADVIKVEPPGGDYARRMTWPIVGSQDGTEENSLLFLHINRGKRSVVLDLRRPEGVEAYLDLVRNADVVIEAMRPGALARRGLTPGRLREANPTVVFCSISGYGATGPYRDMPSHGIAYDAWAGQVPVQEDEHGFSVMAEHTSVGIHAGP